MFPLRSTKLSLRALARFVDDLLTGKRAGITESVQDVVTFHRMAVGDADTLAGLLEAAGWSYQVTDGADVDLDRSQIDSGVPPYRITTHKPNQPGEVLFLSLSAFGEWLADPDETSIVRIAIGTRSFRTEAFSVIAEGDPVVPVTKGEDRLSPPQVVKCVGRCPFLPASVKPYLLAKSSDEAWADPGFDTWVRIAMQRLMTALASEVHATEGTLEFSGPPRAVLSTVSAALPTALGARGFMDLQAAAKWVYDSERETETRHRLFAIEFSRSVDRRADVVDAFREGAAVALEGARITHSFGLLELNKDAIKAMMDLRKSVAEDTSKVTESMRQLSLSVAGALFYGLAIVAAKMGTQISPIVLDVMAVVGAGYVFLIIWLNFRHLAQQKTLRSNWRMRFYRFLRVDDYKSMVEEPISAVEGSLRATLFISIVLTAVAFGAVVAFNHLGSSASV